MVQNNKVLTVSYGTFSCTLEGFEDSFGTMQAIAEYFRDLAADDRYFGAEPPQPDAEMLARIAQREVTRQVEARTDNQGIVLRATEAAPAAIAAAAAAPAPQVEDAVEAPEAPQPAPATPEAPVAEAAQPAPVTETPAPSYEPAPPPSPEPAFIAEPEVAELVAEPVEEPAPAANSITEKLQRIRAVVSDSDLEEAEEEYSEDEHASDADAVIAETVADLSAALEVDAEYTDAINEADQSEAYEDEGDLAAPEQAAIFDEPIAEQTTEEPVAEDLVEEPAEEPFVALDEQQDEVADQAADADAETVADVETEEDVVVVGDFDGDDETFASDVHDDDAPDDDEDFGPARVVKVAHDEFDALADNAKDDPDFSGSLSDEDEEDLLRELAEVEAELKAAASDEDDEDQDSEDLGDADAHLEDDLDEDEEAPYALNVFADDEGDDDKDTADQAVAASEQATLPPAAEDNEEDLSRLMAAADAKLDDPTSSTNRETYSHLRAAVAAAEAERNDDEDAESEQSAGDDPYRTDLASVVRPRRPVASEGGERPRASRERPAPLKLVAEQRVDLPQTADSAGPVRPRRIASDLTEDQSSESTGDFAEFAADQGASSLPDLLEAAAAYLSFVEGREQFSRPQLMNTVRQLDNQQFNREDGLRSFGQLLRDGKIEKTGGGRFTAAGSIGFRPDNRAAG